MTKNRMRSVGFAGMFSLGVSACGDPELGQMEGQENVAEEESAVLTGATDFSFELFPPSQTFESETDAVTSSSGVTYVGYNTSYNPGPGALITYVPNTVNGVTVEDRIVCAGASQAGYTTRRANGALAKSRMPPPAGTAVLWGDPALTNLGNTIFYSSLSIPNTRFQSKVNFNGCMRFSDLDPRYYRTMGAADAIRGACIGESHADQGFPGPFSRFSCFGNAFFLDGGSMTHTTNFMYAAYWNTNTNRALVMRGAPNQQFVELPPSPITDVRGHTVLTVNGNVIWMLAPTGGTTLKLAGYSETTNTWSAVTTIATDQSHANVVLKSTGTQIRSRGGHTITTVSNPPAPARLNIFYHKKSGNFMRIQGVSCGFGGDLIVGCAPVAKWVTPSTDNAFIPAAAQVSRQVPGAPFPSFRHFISYYSDEGQATGGVRLRFTEVTSTNAFTASFGPGQAQWPCVMPPDYWTDYDAMYSRNNGGANWGTLARTVTDSSHHQCDQRAYRAFPQHVSELTFTPQ